MSLFSRFRQGLSNSLVNVGQGTTPHASLDSPRAFQLVATLGVIALIGSGVLTWYDIHRATRAPQTPTTNTSALAELNKLKTKDTDGDTLSDYDELYSYHTSPYLKDSDGDGTPDNEEIKSGDDPNCPKGKICSSFALLTSPTDANGNLTPAFLRQALRSAGVPQAQLDQTDDATLLKIYQDSVKNQPTTNTNTNTTTTANTNTNSATTTNTNTSSSLQQFNNLSATQIRQLLIQNGVDQSTLDNVDDQTLLQIFQQASQSNQ